MDGQSVSSKTHPDHDRFGKAGITIDDAWLASFDRFAADVLPTLLRSLAKRQLLLKPRARRFAVGSVEWGYVSKLGGLKTRIMEG